MKILEKILNSLIRILNIPIILVNVFMIIVLFFVLIFILVPIEIVIATPIYYIVTGEWYFNEYAFDEPVSDWFPIAFNIDTYLERFPYLIIPEINLSKYYGGDKKLSSL